MVDCEKRFATLTHLSLRGEQLFRCGFVSDFRVRRDVCETVD